MSFESSDTENGDDALFNHGTSTDDSEFGEISKHVPINHLNNTTTKQSETVFDFSEYMEIYEQIYKFYSNGEEQTWQDLFKDLVLQSSEPYYLLYMFLHHTLSTANTKKHKMVIPLIEQFKQVNISSEATQLDETVKRDILMKMCRRCAFTQLEPVVDVFDLHSADNRSIVAQFINEQIEQRQDITFISQMAKVLKVLETDSVQFEKIIVPLILKTQWETVKLLVGDNKTLQKKLVETIDQLMAPDKTLVCRFFAKFSMNINEHFIDVHILKRAARKLIKQYNMNFHDFPNLALYEKSTFLKTLFVRKYLDRIHQGDDDDQSWNEQIKELVHDDRGLQIKLIDLFVDYTDLDAGVEWAHLYKLEEFEIPEQIKLRRQQILDGDTTSRSVPIKPPTWSDKSIIDHVYNPIVTQSDILYIELESDVDPFLNRLECARCKITSNLPFVGFDCETFTDPTQRTLNSQIVSTIQLVTLLPSRNQYVYGIFDMLALRLQLDIKSLAEFGHRLFCSRDFVLLTYNYACDSSSLLENYPSMNEALMQGTAVIDLFRVQQYMLKNCPEIFPYYNASSSLKSRGLSELVRLCFGKPLDKSMQTSDWRKRPLKQAQLIYSVLDAQVLVDVALLIENRAKHLNVEWSWSDFKGYVWTNKAFRKRTGMNQTSENSS